MPYFDQHYFDQGISPDAEKTPADTIVVTEAFGYSAICEWFAVGSSSLADALGYAHGINLLVKETAGTPILFLAYQTGTDGATGLVFRKSDDLGYTWAAEVQIDAKQDTHACCLINPSTFNIHLVYSMTGDPALAAATDVKYRVLTWGGATWAIGAEKELFGGSASYAVGNLSLERRDAYLMAVGLHRDSGNDRAIYSFKAAGSWDLYGSCNTDEEVQLLDGVEIQAKLVRNDDDDEWYIVAHQGGDFRIYQVNESARPPGEITLTAKHTWYESSTPQFDACYNSTLGKVGIVQNDAGNIIYYEYDPSDDSLTGPTTLDSSVTCYWPAISNDRDRFVIVYARVVAGNQRELVAQWSDLPGTVVPFCTDPVAEAWGHIKIARSTEYVDGVFLCWCDTVDSLANGYAVYYGRLHIRTMRAIAETIAATDYIQTVDHAVAEAIAAAEALHATEPKSIADTVLATEAILHGPQVAETISAVDAIVGSGILLNEDVAVTDAIEQLNRVLADTIAAADVVSKVNIVAVVDAVTATDAIVTVGRLLADNIVVVDAISAFGIAVAEAVAAGEALVVSLTLTDVIGAADLGKVEHAVTDVISATDLINMIYQVLESVGVAENVTIAPQTVVDTIGAADALVIEIPVADTVGLADALAKVSLLQLTVRLHLVGAKPTLRVEGTTARGIVAQ